MNTVNLEAEKSVLGAILIDPSKLKKVRDIISWKDFSDSTNQWVFRCMEWLDKQDIEVDIITLTDAMKKAGVYETIGSAYPLELTEHTPTSARVLDYAKIVKSCSDARKMGDIVSQASHIASEGGDIDEAVKKIKEKLNEVNNLGGKSNKYQVVSMAEFSEEAKARFDNWGKLQGISTGFPSLDSLTLGLVGGELIIIAGATSRGKLERVSEIVPTPTGDRRFGDLKVGDYVFGSNGKPTMVTGVFPNGMMDIYRVHMSDNSYLDVGKEHLWTLQRKNRPDRVLSTADLIKKIPSRGYTIPTVEPLEYSDTHTPADPYLVGLYIADGSFKFRQATITKKSGSVVDYISTIDEPKRRDEYEGHCGRFIFMAESKLSRYIKSCGLSEVKSAGKFIPQEWFTKSYEIRLRLIRGLMDGDGSYLLKRGQKHRTMMYHTASEQLANDFVRLVTSCGWVAVKGVVKHKKGNYSRVSLRSTRFTNPFLKSKEADIWRPLDKEEKRRPVKVELVGREEAMCIKVAAEDQLYVGDTRFHIVTHNTLLAMNIANNIAKTGKRVLFVTLEMTHAELTSRYMYINGGADSRDYKTVALNTLFQQNDELDWRDIDGLIKNAKERLDVDLVIIDHLHYFSRDTVNTAEDLGRITKEFKKNAIRYNIPIILISHIRKMAKDEQLSGESLRGCLPFDEKVMTDRGEIRIKDIKAGDKIISTTEDLKKTIEPVTAKWETGSKLIYRITLEDGRSIRVSGSHRILTLFGYTRAENLFAGDYVFVHKSPKVNKRRSGLTELKVTRVEALEEMLTYDLEIATTHNYAVNGVVTHNSSLIAQDSDIVLLVDRDPKTNEMGVMIDKNRNRGKLSDRTKDWNGQSDREVNTVFLEFNSTKLRDPKTLPEGISELFPGAKVVPITNKEKE